MSGVVVQETHLKGTVHFRKIAEEHDFLESVDFDSPFDAVSALAEVLNSDSEMLFLDIGTLVKVCLYENLDIHITTKQ